MEEQDDVLSALRTAFPAAVLGASAPYGDATIVIRPEALLPVMEALKSAHGYVMLLDLTVVDYPDRAERFEVVYHLLSLSRNARLRVKLSVPESAPVAASLTGLWKNADWLEREAFDMFGVRFEGHPNLTRLFMYDGFEGHPLRKDYALKHRQPLIALRK
jgi:NADH-quinone oxidoreductase subunit C